jgi:hypothetical protein
MWREIQAAVDTVEGRLDKTEATNVEANPEETGAAVDTVEGILDKTEATNVEANSGCGGYRRRNIGQNGGHECGGKSRLRWIP